MREDPRFRVRQEFCVVFVFEEGCQEDCGVDGSPGHVDGRPFGMDQSLFAGFGVLQGSQGLSHSSQESARVKKANISCSESSWARRNHVLESSR